MHTVHDTLAWNAPKNESPLSDHRINSEFLGSFTILGNRARRLASAKEPERRADLLVELLQKGRYDLPRSLTEVRRFSSRCSGQSNLLVERHSDGGKQRVVWFGSGRPRSRSAEVVASAL